MEHFIVGGSYVRIEQFPYSVYLYLYMKCNLVASCGGSVLTQNLVMTAAHCFEGCVKKYNILSYMGNAAIEEFKAERRIDNFIVHGKYNTKTVNDDVALGYIKSAWPLGDTIKRVMIARNVPGVKLTKIAGWGHSDEETSEQASKLKMVSQIILPIITCKESITFQPGMMCAVANNKNYPSCGDSGSALVSGAGQQIGVVSFRTPKRVDLVYYINVSYYYNWINSYVTQLQCTS